MQVERNAGSDRTEGRRARAYRIATKVVETGAGAIAGADTVVRRAGFTTKSGRISKGKIAVGLLRPRSSGRRLIRAAATEIDRRRAGSRPPRRS